MGAGNGLNPDRCMTLGSLHGDSGTSNAKTTVKSENTDTLHFFLDNTDETCDTAGS